MASYHEYYQQAHKDFWKSLSVILFFLMWKIFQEYNVTLQFLCPVLIILPIGLTAAIRKGIDLLYAKKWLE